MHYTASTEYLRKLGSDVTSTDASIAQATPHHFSASALQSQSALEHKSQSDRLLQQSDGRLTIRAYAKINLGLRIFPARADGFHPLESWMVPISWYDTLFVSAGGPLNLRITGRTAGVPTEIDKNLVGKAAVKLAAAAGITPTGTIELHKVLPPGGGLGPGPGSAGTQAGAPEAPAPKPAISSMAARCAGVISQPANRPEDAEVAA